MNTPPTQPRFPWHTVVIAVLTAGLLWMFFRNIDLAEAWRAVTHAHLGLIAAAVGMIFVTYSLRAQRWLILLRPLGPVRFRTTFRTTVIGFAMIFLLPGRVGEILRPYLVAREEGLNPASTFATVIIERLLDVVTVVTLFAAALFLSGVDVGEQARIGGVVAAAGALGALVVLFFFARHPERLGKFAGQLGRRLPAKLSGGLAGLVQTFAEGLVVLRSPVQLVVAVCWSLCVWASIAIGIWLTSHAFDLSLTPVGSFIVVGYLAVGVSIPTPGGAGGFHYFYLVALRDFFGADPTVAATAAIVLHAVSFVPVTILGLTFMWQDGLTLGRLRNMKAEAQAAEHPGAVR
jgi:uncharacterized protein (TIRG00374 family)